MQNPWTYRACRHVESVSAWLMNLTAILTDYGPEVTNNLTVNMDT